MCVCLSLSFFSVCFCLCVCLSVSLFLSLCVCVYLSFSLCVSICVYICVCVCVSLCVYVCAHACTHKRSHTWVHVEDNLRHWDLVSWDRISQYPWCHLLGIGWLASPRESLISSSSALGLQGRLPHLTLFLCRLLEIKLQPSSLLQCIERSPATTELSFWLLVVRSGDSTHRVPVGRACVHQRQLEERLTVVWGMDYICDSIYRIIMN